MDGTRKGIRERIGRQRARGGGIYGKVIKERGEKDIGKGRLSIMEHGERKLLRQRRRQENRQFISNN